MEKKPLHTEKYGRPRTAENIAEESPEGEYKAFGGTVDNTAQELMIQFRWKDGRRKSISYSYLVSTDYDGSGKIEMEFVGYNVTLTGRGFNELDRRLSQHKVSFLQELDAIHAAADVPEGETVVTFVEVKKV